MNHIPEFIYLFVGKLYPKLISKILFFSYIFFYIIHIQKCRP